MAWNSTPPPISFPFIGGLPQKILKIHGRGFAKTWPTVWHNIWADTYCDRDSVYPYPRKVGILIHGRNASSAEQFILEAKNSEKVTLFGNEPTLGAIDLSNVYSFTSPLGWFRLGVPTTRSCRWPDIVIDGKGIAPQIPVPYPDSMQERDHIGEEILYIERVLRGIPCRAPANESTGE